MLKTGMEEVLPLLFCGVFLLLVYHQLLLIGGMKDNAVFSLPTSHLAAASSGLRGQKPLLSLLLLLPSRYSISCSICLGGSAVSQGPFVPALHSDLIEGPGL